MLAVFGYPTWYSSIYISKRGGNHTVFNMQQTIPSNEQDSSEDAVENVLRNISQNIIIFVFGLLPIFFIPVSYVPFDYAKTIFVICGVLLSIIFFSLSVLRSGKIQINAPVALWSFWAVALGAIISAVLSGDMRDALLGDTIGVHTGLFVLLLALVATVSAIVGQTKTSIMRLYMLLTGSAVVLCLFHAFRLLFGAKIFSFGIFTSLVNTPLGGWNDLALFFGLAILLSIVALEQLQLRKWVQLLLCGIVGVSLLLLAVVNFFAVWIVLALVSLMVLMYTLSKDRFSEKTLTLEGKKSSVSVYSVVLTVAIFIVSVIFIIGGASVGGSLSKITHISYVEVRPSFGATTDIARHVYKENAFVGIGTNKFTDAWRLYKDPSINQTIFWGTDFDGGSGYLTTLFITTGLLGTGTWIVFFGLFLYSGFRMLFRSRDADRAWYFIGSSSFVASAYLWGMAFVYVPGAALLLLASAFTSIMFGAYCVLVPTKTLSFSIAANRRAGFVLVGFVMIIIVGATTGIYYAGQNFISVHGFGNAIYGLQQGTDIKTVEQEVATAFEASKNEAYALQLASYQLAKINALANIEKLTDAQQQELQISIRNGINAGQIAVQQDPTDAPSWSTLGSIYSVLAGASVEGAKDKAQESFSKARTFDPTNPLYVLLEAQLDSRTADLAGARAKTLEAIQLKPNYTDALFFLTQLDITEGKTADAIETTKSIISLEPANPARRYQLGILESASGKQDEAITAFKQAIELDTNYANARYFLAIALAQKGENAAAIEQLQAVLALNPGNTEVTSLITQLQSGKPLVVTPQETSQQVGEPETVSTDEEAVTTTEAPDTSLITPVNTVGDTEEKPAGGE